jgi:hypothetical protein
MRPRDATSRAPVIAFMAMLSAWWVMYALVAWWTPIQGEDWGQLAWLGRHDPIGLEEVFSALYREPTTGDIGHLVGVALPSIHAVLAPTIIVLFVVGLFAFSFARRPDPRSWEDLWKLAFLHALVWLGAPRVGVIFGHRPHVTHFVYGLCAALWVLAAFRAAGPSVRNCLRRSIGMGALALFGGASNHHVAAAAIAYMVVTIVRRRRRGEPVPAWMWTSLATTTVGLALLFTNPNPYFAAIGKRGVATTFGQILYFLNEAGETVALASLLAFATLLKSRWRGTPMPVPSLGELAWMTTCFFGGFVIMALAVFGPRWGEPSMFAPSVLFVAGGVVALVRLADDAWVKRAMIALTVVVHAIVAVHILPAYHEAHRYGELRMQQLEAPPPGGVATVTPFPQVGIGFWFLGEDLGFAATRETAAVDVFDLEDIVFDRETGAYEPSTGLEMHVEVDFDPQPSPEEVQRIVGRRVARSLLVARGQFRRVLVELGKRAHLKGGALVVDNLDWPERRGRPVYAGRFVAGKGLIMPRAYWLQPDQLQRMRFHVYWGTLKTKHNERRDELYVMGMGDVLPVTRGSRYVYFVPKWAGTYVLVACNAADCLVVDSAWARY